MWLLVYIFSTTVTEQSELAGPHDFLNGAVAGFDPFFMTSIKTPNPGRRSLLFQHLWKCYYDSQFVPSYFINNEEETNCFPDLSIRNLVNYKDFKDFSSSSAYALSFDANWGTLTGYENFTSCENENDFQDRAMLQFFKDTGGEVVVASLSCVTHTITIAPFEPVAFTPAFQSALVTLYKAALNPMPEIRNTVFTEFIRFYGTHFSRRTRLGSRIIFGKLFSTRAATVDEETARRRCVQEAAYEALTPGARRSNETTRTVFTRASSERCGGGEHKAMVSVTGPLPGGNLEDWATNSKKSPEPIFHDLEPLSSLFNKDWFDAIHQSMQLDMNGTTLHSFFQEHLSDYSSRMVCGGSNKSPSRGCTIDSNCTNGTECRNEPYTTPGYICVPKDDATTTTGTTSTTTTPAPTTTSTTTTTTTPSTTTSATSTTTPAPTTTTTLKPCPACQTCPACKTCQICPTCPACRTCQTCPSCPTCPRCPTCQTCPTCSRCSASGGLLIAVKGETKTLTSHPGFGTSNYEDFATFSHFLVAPVGHKVRIRLQSFSTEYDYDNLHIYDGISPSGSLLAKLSGTPQTFASYTSKDTRVLLIFTTDGAVVSTGFSLLYDAVV